MKAKSVSSGPQTQIASRARSEGRASGPSTGNSRWVERRCLAGKPASKVASEDGKRAAREGPFKGLRGRLAIGGLGRAAPISPRAGAPERPEGQRRLTGAPPRS